MLIMLSFCVEYKALNLYNWEALSYAQIHHLAISNILKRPLGAAKNSAHREPAENVDRKRPDGATALL